jgi:hypothetical protein
MSKSWPAVFIAFLCAVDLWAQEDWRESPSRFLQLELLNIGLGWGYGQSGYTLGSWEWSPSGQARVLGLTYSDRRLRIGLAAIDLYSFAMSDVLAFATYLPVRVGYNILTRPVQTWRLYGMIPSCYAEATMGIQGWMPDTPLYARLALACDLDYFGPGVGIEASAASLLGYDSSRHKAIAAGVALCLNLKFRLATSLGL